MSIKSEIRDEILFIALNRPEKRNAFTREMVLELRRLFKSTKQQTSLRAVFLRGEGPSFSTGADLSLMRAAISQSKKQNLGEAKELFEMFLAVRECQVPVLAKVQGHVMGGALGLICAADFVAAVDGTEFGFSEVRLGIAPAVISSFCVEKLGPARSKRWMLTGDRFSTADAISDGLIQFAGSESEADEFCDKILASLLLSGPLAVRKTKALINFVSGKDPAKTKDYTAKLIAELRTSSEGQTGLKGFLEKTPVTWRKEYRGPSH